MNASSHFSNVMRETLHPLFGPVVSDLQLQTARVIIILMLLGGSIASFWMACSLIYKFINKTKQRRPKNWIIDRILLTIACFHFAATCVEVALRIQKQISRASTIPESSYESRLRFFVKELIVSSFEISFMWEAILMLQIFLFIKCGPSQTLNLIWCWSGILVVVFLRIPNNLWSEPYNKHLYDNILLLIVMVFNVSVIGILFYYTRSRASTSRISNVIKRTLVFPALYLVCVVPRTMYMWISIVSGIHIHRYQTGRVICDVLSYSYFFISICLFGLSQQCLCFQKNQSQIEHHEDNWLMSCDEFEINREHIIGTGAIGTVYRGFYRGTEVAIKQIVISDLGDVEFQTKLKRNFQQEAITLRRLAHPNIVYFMGAFIERSNGYIVCEYCSCGSLRTLLNYFRHQPDAHKQIHWGWKIRIALGAARGLLYLHDTARPGLIHRDIKSPNVFITESLTAKIGDFGTARLIAAVERSRCPGMSQKRSNNGSFTESVLTTPVGTTRWAAPEVVKNMRQGQVLYTKATDIYSFGVVLWELITYKVPFEELKFNFQVEAAILKGHRPRSPVEAKFSSEFVQLVKKCCSAEPNCRPKAQDIVDTLEKLARNIDTQFDHLALMDFVNYPQRHTSRTPSPPSSSDIKSNLSSYVECIV